MSTSFSNARSIPPGRLAGLTVAHPQSYSGPSPAAPRQGWSNWAERRWQRAALRELADDRHMLDDPSITREQALDEAAKPFWR